MGSIKVILPDDLEERFREEIYKSKGMKKGNIKKAIGEAIILWIEAEGEKRSKAAEKAWKGGKRDSEDER